MTLPRRRFVPLDHEYARAVLDSRETPQRFDDALRRIDAGHVALDGFYEAERGRGTPLALAVQQNELAIVDELLRRGGDPNARCVDEATEIATPPIVHMARSVEVLERLVAAGARLDAASIGGEAFLRHCIRMTRVTSHPSWTTMATRAVALGADPKQRDDLEQDAAAFAASMGARVAKAYASIVGVAAAPAKAAKTENTATKRVRRKPT